LDSWSAHWRSLLDFKLVVFGHRVAFFGGFDCCISSAAFVGGFGTITECSRTGRMDELSSWSAFGGAVSM
jgi:hypothetical protein